MKVLPWGYGLVTGDPLWDPCPSGTPPSCFSPVTGPVPVTGLMFPLVALGEGAFRDLGAVVGTCKRGPTLDERA